MNRLHVELIIDTTSRCPDEWIADLVLLCLEEGEKIVAVRSSLFDPTKHNKRIIYGTDSTYRHSTD